MESERFLVTGALGCIGAWTVKHLVDMGVPVWTYDLPGSDHRLRLVLRDEQFTHVTQTVGDITDQATFERTVVDNGITRIVHLAGLQVPLQLAQRTGYHSPRGYSERSRISAQQPQLDEWMSNEPLRNSN